MNSQNPMPTRIPLVLLALAATGTAGCLSIFAGWQRGGLVVERVLLTCLSVVLVMAAHLLPAFCRPHGWRIRVLGAALWVGCMGMTCYSHAVFFVTAQKHAGDARAAAIPAAPIPERSLTQIASDRASAVARLARVTERRCEEGCAAVRIERKTLSARLVALDAESTDVRRRERALDRADDERTAAKADPFAAVITDFGLAPGQAHLIAGIGFSMVLEGVACFCWLLTLRPAYEAAISVIPEQKVSHGLAITRAAPASTAGGHLGNDVVKPPNVVRSPPREPVNDLTVVHAAIRDGKVRATVAEIRRHLRCSQAKAAALRKQLVTTQSCDREGIKLVRNPSTVRQASLNLGD
ncbi:hypothetical protein [Burkholderia sp. 9120]|uniref:hypothetical protein n=1 Tax=Burkholderia sp. 9120 TaxID=1500897 RepID=UPI0007C7ACE6|nr:hypothetical protein [Burkholderia sp. 9120]